MNVLCFTGNLGRDAEANNVNGHAVLNFAVPVKSGFGQNEQTLWVDCALWGKQAEGQLINYLRKGQRVSVSGELGSREYPAQDGTTKTVITCRVNRVGLEGSANPAQQGGQQQQQRQPAQQQQQRPAQQQRQPAQQQQQQRTYAPAGMDDFDDDIPF
ncbi:MAG: single-stranded DNA-binding protein [Motiliproteus sp.]